MYEVVLVLERDADRAAGTHPASARPAGEQVAASAHSTASATPGGLVSGSRRSSDRGHDGARRAFGDARCAHHHDAHLALGDRISIQ